MRRALLLAALAASALVTGATVAPAVCQGDDCPPYNRVCYTSSDCGFSCGMTCMRIEGTFTRRCR